MFELILSVGGGKPIELLPHTGFRYSNDFVKSLFVLNWRWSDMGNLFEFMNRNESKEDGTRVWRSDTPFDQFSLPATPYMTLPKGATSFVDEDAPRGSVYYYLLEVFKGVGNSEFTGPLKATAGAINTGPGPQTMIAGDHLSGFYGETPVSDLINGTALASAAGLTAGTAQHSNEPWLKFNLDDRTLFVAKRPYRYNLSWNQLQAVNAVRGGKTVAINGDTYRIRLLKGSATDPYVGVAGFDTPGGYGSEWNRLFYPLIPNPSSAPSHPVSGEGLVYGSWADYTETELVLVAAAGNGSANWCQESQGTSRVVRSVSGVSYLLLSAASSANTTFGWRPVLELVV